ncbi:MAG: 2-oxoacid:acceptor oxidoreductase subunit alpha [Clostridiales bacterium]|jgi:2-oxoglutarate ferredoxin oxidoreductase subunit alpha|nr:2-oxoacid:acceptor oxidoreductase subunit alpha [Clostridiales bacterium]
MDPQNVEPLPRGGRKVILQGNEACAKAAVYAGCRFFAGYPITPSTEIIENLSAEMVNVGGSFIQMEDEIASACAIVGARWGGKKAMTATSGPGFTLMQETIGFAAVTETPVVIVNVQRGGPSTGQPTMSSQQDIYQVKYGSHGDYEIIALTPSSVQEMYDFTIRAFELSEKFRTPVILLADEVVGHMREKITIYDGERKIRGGHRNYVVSPQEDFYTGGNCLVEGQLHDEEGKRIGHLAEKSGEFIRSISGKILNHIDEIQDVESYFMDNADIAILAYGSVSRPALNAVKLAKGIKLSADEKEGKLRFLKRILRRKYTGENPYSHLNVGLIKVNAVWPFPEKEIQRLAAKCRYVFVPEMNAGKYYKEIERCLWGSTVISLPKIGGEIHSPAELMESIANEVKDDE